MSKPRFNTSDLHAGNACLTAHVLDLASGRPARDIKIDLLRHVSGRLEPAGTAITNSDGRLDAPLLTCDTAQPGRYTIVFGIGNGFLGTVPVEFEILEVTRHYHVPLVVSPFGYSTYRGAPPDRAPGNGYLGQGAPLAVPEGTAPPPGSVGPGMTVHVIDIANGAGAGGMTVDVIPPAVQTINSLATTSEGRTPEWLVDAGKLERGTYELCFDFKRYFQGLGARVGMRPFFPRARVRFRVDDPAQHYHIALLAAPWGYTCYRGS